MTPTEKLEARINSLQGTVKQLEADVKYYRDTLWNIQDRDTQITNKFRDLIIEVLGRT